MTPPHVPAFVAYSSRDEVLASLILDAVRRANAIPTHIRYEPWVDNDISGNPIVSPILSRIDESLFVVADITYLNLNVIYEIGFSIGRSKRIFLVRHGSTEGDKPIAKEVGIFDTIGYHEYPSVDGLVARLTSHIDPTPLTIGFELDRKAPIYIVEPPTRTGAATRTTSRIKKAGYRYRSFNPSEDIRLSASDAMRQVGVSAGVVMLLQDREVGFSEIHNIRVMFVAGLAHGMGKPTLILAPAGYEPPLDIRDQVKFYKCADDITEHVAEFCPEVTHYLQQVDPPSIEARGILEALSIGDPTAENEMTTLSHYYLQTDQYRRALRGEVNIVIGRKGSGKTALFIQLRDKIRADKRNIVVDLKPEGYQLIKLKEDILGFLTDGARQHLITAFWEYLILLEVAYKLLEKDKLSHKHNHEIRELYFELDAAYRVEDFSIEGDFSERLLALSVRIAEKYKGLYGLKDGRKLTTEQVTELLYSHDIRALRKKISAYLEKKVAVWVLFDNLDKGWSTQGVDIIDAIVLRCLIDAGRKVAREMRKAGHPFNCIAFVRNDVYEHLMRNSADYGKEMSAVLDWTDPDMLKEMLRLRLISHFGDRASEVQFDQIWLQVCTSHVQGEESSSYIINRSLMRPRNVLKIFNHSRGFAVNFNRQKISDEDIEKGIKSYSQDLLVELDHELSDVFPEAPGILYFLADAPSLISRDMIHNIIKEAGVEEGNIDRVVDFLLYYGVIGLRFNEADLFIYNLNYDLKLLKIRAARMGKNIAYTINPAFWPALAIEEIDYVASGTIGYPDVT